MSNHYDVIVVGLGAMGSATLYQLAGRGVKVLGLDQYAPPHNLGSTHGETRITRLAVGEGDAYVPLVRRTHEIWRELEAATGETLLLQSGGLVIAPNSGSALFHGVESFVTKAARIARQYGIDHSLLSAAEIRAMLPMLKVNDTEHAIYEPTGGVVSPERAVAVQLQLAQARNATVQINEKVLSYRETGDGVTVTTTKGTYSADKLVLTTGPWLTDLLAAELHQPFGVYRQVIYWFEAKDLEPFRLDNFPFVIWIGDVIEDFYTLFPTPDFGTPAVKMLTEEYLDATHPDEVDRTVQPHEIERMVDTFIATKVEGITHRCVDAGVCLYTVTPDEHFIIDWQPGSQRVLVASPCSGHGFKHSAAIGEALAEMASGGSSTIDMSAFRFERIGL